ncbi:MAG: hypothetical protein ACR2I2_00640 [Bryobacteraceae bacterium]
MAASNPSPKTIQKHVDNVWALGGEFLRDLDHDPSPRKRPVDQVLFKMIEYGGPILYHGGEISKGRLIPLAEDSGGSSSKVLTDPRGHPQISPTSQKKNPPTSLYFCRAAAPPLAQPGGSFL